MKYKFLVTWFLSYFLPLTIVAKAVDPDSLLNVIETSTNDSLKLSAYINLSFYLRNTNPDSARVFAEQGLAFSQSVGYKKGQAMAWHQIGNVDSKKGDFEKAIGNYEEALKLHRTIADSLGVADNFQGIGNAYRRLGELSTALRYQLECKSIRENFGGSEKSIAYAHLNIGNIYFTSQEYDKAIKSYQQVVDLYKELNNWHDIALVYNNIFAALYQQGQFEESLVYLEKSLVINDSLGNTIQKGVSLSNLSEVNAELGHYDKAYQYAIEGLHLFENIQDSTFIQNTLINLGNISHRLGRYDEAIEYNNRSLSIAKKKKVLGNIPKIYESLAEDYIALGDYKAAYNAKDSFLLYKDSLATIASERELNELKTQYETERIESENAQLRIDQINRKKINRWLMAGLCLATILGLLAWWALHQRQIAYRHLKAQKEGMETLLKEKEQLYSELKQTQVQLLQSEKMASIGQLTAGIAHELNNPISFVSANSVALKQDVEEIREILAHLRAFKNEPTPEKQQKLIDIYEALDMDFLDEEILELINSIVRGAARTKDIITSLRVFSRNTTEEFDPANVNEGLDSTLTILNSQLMNRIEVHKDYGQLPQIYCQITKINQVFLNIINNSIQAIIGEGHIYIATRLIEDETVQITIRDTGKGIPEEVQKRVFEPFFTTKEVGEGTGLGLSISYSIIEQHGGQIAVQSQEGDGTTFVIELPVDEKR